MIFVYRESMGAVLWNKMCKTANHLGRYFEGKSDDGSLVCICTEPYG